MSATFLFLRVTAIAVLFSFFTGFLGSSSFQLNSDKETYDDKWEQVSAFESKGLPKSALEVVEEIYSMAIADNNDEQIIKASLYRFKYVNMTEDDGYVLNILNLEKEVLRMPPIASAFAYLLLAEFYSSYYQNNYYQISQRTRLADFKPDDLQTWDESLFKDKIIKSYNNALADTLKTIAITDYPQLIEDAKHGVNTYPTLYDFLIFQAINKFQSPDAYSYYYYYNPNDKSDFEFTEPVVLDVAENFVSSEIIGADSISYNFQIYSLFKDWLKFRLSRENEIDAIVNADLLRMEIMLDKSRFAKKDEAFLLGLKKMHTEYAKYPALTSIDLQIANYLNNQGSKYNPSDTTTYHYAPYKKEAYNLLQQAIELYPEKIRSYKLKNLQKKIKEPSLSFSLPAYHSTDERIPIKIEYKNIDELYCSVLKIDYFDLDNIQRKYYNDEDLLKKIIKKSDLVSTERIPIIKSSDYNSHKLTYLNKSVGKGFYIILLHKNKTLEVDDNLMQYGEMYITDIAYTSRNMNDGTTDVYVFDRKSGKPLKNAQVSFYVEKYNYIKSEYEYKKQQSTMTDNDGYVKYVAPEDSYYSVRIRIAHADEEIIANSYMYSYNYGENKNKRVAVNLFTDRAIYRPGQTVYYKGICMNTDGINPELLPKYTTNVFLRDPNYQEVESQTKNTNKYGSFSGSFTIPQGNLTGRYEIVCQGGSHSIRVEEYKRPNFEVKILPIEGEFKIGDKVNVKGEAKTYAGTSLTDAKVIYTVTRTPQWFGYRYYSSYSEPVEIAFGETITDNTGNFSFDFSAIGESDMPDKSNLYFSYTINAVVTDINGETQSTQSWVTAGNKSLLLSSDLKAQINIAKLDSIRVYSNNLNGQKISAMLNVKFELLEDPGLLLKNNANPVEDRRIYSKDEWYELYEGNEYSDELDYTNWDSKKIILSNNINTAEKQGVAMSKLINKIDNGVYRLTITSTDKYGNKVEYVAHSVLYRQKDTDMPYTATNFFVQENQYVEPGDEAVFYIGSSYKDVKVLMEIENKTLISQKSWIEIDNELKRIAIPVTEDHRGNFSVHLMYVKNGQIYAKDYTVTVPWTNKKLNLEFVTFRDKILPGSKEEWKLKITGPDGNPADAELMAAMYDASLDAFAANTWYFNVFPVYYSYKYWEYSAFTEVNSQYLLNRTNAKYDYVEEHEPYLNWFGLSYFGYNSYYRNQRTSGSAGLMKSSADKDGGGRYENAPAGETEEEVLMDLAIVDEEDKTVSSITIAQDQSQEKEVMNGEEQAQNNEPIKARTNFNETAFFYPQLATDEEGNVLISFTAPESLTRWKVMGFAHTADLKSGSIYEELITQKELMLMPNVPRFLRENDKIFFTTKINNITDYEVEGIVSIEFFDALTNKTLSQEILVNKLLQEQQFKISAGGNSTAQWEIEVPEGVSLLGYRLVAKGGKHTDAEERVINVLPNRMLVTESMPLPIRGNTSKDFNMDKLINSEKSHTLSHYKLTLEFTSNPAWYAVQALPYLMEYPYECAEQTFSRFYANSLATYIANSDPKIKRVFEAWKNEPQGEALLSNLEKNQDLKAVMLEETPWVLQAQDETERKHRIALLFDLNKMAVEQEAALQSLQKMQVYNGAWPWFEGMPESRWITQHIVCGLGHLKHLGVLTDINDRKLNNMIQKAVGYLDNEMVKDYKNLLKYYTEEEMKDKRIGYTQIHYLYTRSYFLNDYDIPKKSSEAYEYYLGQAKKYWLNESIYMQGMMALVLYRNDDEETAKSIIASIKEHAIYHDELGMYWKQNRGYYWYQAPIERQAMLIEAFDEISGDEKAVEEMKIWLLKQKQTQDWKTTKATVEAIYALLIKGTDLLADDQLVEIVVGSKKIDPKKLDGTNVQAGTGYFRTSWDGKSVKPEMGNIKVTKKTSGVAWGALYWQYFEQLDKISVFEETPLTINKKLFVEERVGDNLVMKPVSEKNTLKVGDRVIVRVEIRTDRDMEYVHLKDMRAACFEPESVLSGYRYRNGLGYYESIRDASMNFFISYLLKGTYVFEYSLRVSQKGEYSNGITTMQCMYAPEFASHSEGIRVNVE
jgi:uncharacterized protein YfaS (alpha-2-macroglobulin family)